jgi:hypothetical protein
VDQERQPVGQVGYPLDVLGVPGVRFVEPADARHVVEAERSQYQPRLVAGRVVVARGRDRPIGSEDPDHQEPGCQAPSGEVGHELERLGVGEVQVIEHQHHGPAIRPGREMAHHRGREVRHPGGVIDLPDRPIGTAKGLVHQRAGTAMSVVAPPVQDDGAVAVRLASDLRDQAGLAGALGTEDRHEAAPAVVGIGPRRSEPGDLTVASHERRADGCERQRQPGRPARPGEWLPLV